MKIVHFLLIMVTVILGSYLAGALSAVIFTGSTDYFNIYIWDEALRAIWVFWAAPASICFGFIYIDYKHKAIIK